MLLDTFISLQLESDKNLLHPKLLNSFRNSNPLVILLLLLQARNLLVCSSLNLVLPLQRPLLLRSMVKARIPSRNSLPLLFASSLVLPSPLFLPSPVVIKVNNLCDTRPFLCPRPLKNSMFHLVMILTVMHIDLDLESLKTHHQARCLLVHS